MKKLLLLLLTATISLASLTLPAAASPYRGTQTTSTTTIFISGYLNCGTPIYAKRVKHGQRYHTQRLSSYEQRRYLERQRKTARLQQQRTRSQSQRNRYNGRR